MNDFVQRISDISVENTRRIHLILDEVLLRTVTVFPGSGEMRFNQETVSFELMVNDLVVSITRDLNRFAVITRVISNNSVIAECSIDVVGGFDERYAKFNDKETKLKFATLFSLISEIDIVKLITTNTEPAPSEEEENPTEESVVDTETE